MEAFIYGFLAGYTTCAVWVFFVKPILRNAYKNTAAREERRQSMSIEAMKQWLEALEEACGDRCNAEYNPCHARTAITSLRQAIEQAEKQEPVCPYCHDSHTLGAVYYDQNCVGCVRRMTATPPQREWVGLTDEERHEIREWQKIQEELGPVWAPMMLYLYEAIEAKLRSKNGY